MFCKLIIINKIWQKVVILKNKFYEDYGIDFIPNIVSYEEIKIKNNAHYYLDDSNKLQTVSLVVMHDYGFHINDKAATLLSGISIWTNLEEYGIIEPLVAGDELIITYTGEFIVQETYPATVVKNQINIISIEVIKALVVEFTVTEILGTKELVPVDFNNSNFTLSNSEGYVVSMDNSFTKYSNLPIGSTVYGSISKSSNDFIIAGLYDYNPSK